MRAADLPAVAAIQAVCYGEPLVEPLDVLSDRLTAAPDTCWVAEHRGQVVAYLAAYRSCLGRITPLHGAFDVPAVPDTLYLHDLAVHPQASGEGTGARLVRALWRLATDQGLRWCALVAVAPAGPFWARLGFTPGEVRTAQARSALGSYGDGHYLVRPFSEAAPAHPCDGPVAKSALASRGCERQYCGGA